MNLRSLKGSTSKSTLTLSGPPGWSVETRYGPMRPDGLAVDNPDRRFDRPTGWLVAGNLAIRRDRIADRRVSVASPVDQNLRHNDILAFLNWNLPELVKVFPQFPQRLLIVGAGPGAWRGGLSGPASLYLHADRPLISGNGTSTLLHELIHVAMSATAITGEDWINEGLAEFYSVDLMVRSGTLSKHRSADTFEKLRNWGKEVKSLSGERSSGVTTAAAATFFFDLDQELYAAGASLDAVVYELQTGDQPPSLRKLRSIVDRKLTSPSETLKKWDPILCRKAC